jgi:hypothetical protein
MVTAAGTPMAAQRAAGLEFGLHFERHCDTGDPPGKEKRMGAHRRLGAVVRWQTAATRWFLMVAARLR